MATLGSLIISLEANTAKFEAAMTKAQYTAKKSADAIKATLMGIGTALAGAMSIDAIEDMITSVAKMESSLLKTATRLNTSVETLSSFGVMTRKTGMDTDAFNLALTRMEKSMSVAGMKAEEATNQVDENGEAIQKTNVAWNALGLNVDVLMKLPLDQQLMAIAEAFKKNIDPADRVNIAMQVFGKSGSGMINVMKDGAEGVRKLIAEQQNLGIITTDAAKKSAEFTAATGNLNANWDTFKRNIAEGVIPTLGSLIEKINQAIQAYKDFKVAEDTYKISFPGATPPTGQPGGIRISGRWGGSWRDVGISYQPPLPPESGPYGEMVEPSQYTPMPYVSPAGLTKSPVRPGDIVKGGKGGGGAGDMGLDRMRSIIDTLQKDLSRLTEGSLAEIREWANHTRNEIEKVGRKGAETEEAMRLVATVEGKKKEKAVEDYYLSVAKESGDSYKQIEADMKDWLTKYKGQTDVEINYNKIKNRKIAEEDNRQTTERLSIQKSLLDTIAGETPFYSKQLELRQRILPLEIEINKLMLDRTISGLKLSDTQKDELKALLGVAAAAKKYSLERAKWSREGITGGFKIGGEEIKKSAETFSADTTARLVASLPKEVSTLMASSFIGFLQGKAPDLQALGITMAQSIVQTLLEGILNQIIPSLVEGLASGLESILGGIMGEGGGGIFGGILEGAMSIFGLHQGGMIEAHSGWPLRYDERIIKVQTGERILSRKQNQEYESGMGGGGFGGAIININPRYPMSRQETEHMVRTKLIPAMAKQQKRMGGRYR